MAHCVVEVGTSSCYSALVDSTAEPVLAALCRRIAGDEFRHYKLVLDHMRHYQASERLGLWRRLRVALGRLIESEDDELAFAYCCGAPTVDAGDPAPYDRKRSIRAYGGRTLTLYRFGHVERALCMAFKAVGLAPRRRSRPGQPPSPGAYYTSAPANWQPPRDVPLISGTVYLIILIGNFLG
ncbi:MAG: ferritin-like domain-containing protein [Pseudomonadota bacterium]|nr:ferritin-like domain-containing protein [Pseudomonadota bacterium]